MQHQLAISPLCQITRYTQILTLSLSFSLPFYPSFLSLFRSFLSLSLVSFSLLPSEKAFLRASFVTKVQPTCVLL